MRPRRRCEHVWRPLVTIDVNGLTEEQAQVIGWSLCLQRLADYDRCSLCGRIGWVTKTRFRRRKMIAYNEAAARIVERAIAFEQWVAEYRAEPAVAGELTETCAKG